MDYELWRSLLDETIWFEIDGIEYCVGARGIVQIPSRFHSIPTSRGLALEYMHATFDSNLENLALEPVTKTTDTDKVSIAKVMLSKSTKKKKLN